MGGSSMPYCSRYGSLTSTLLITGRQSLPSKRICLDLTWTKVIMGGSSMFYCRGDCSLHWVFGQIKYCKRICLDLTWTEVIMGGSSMFYCTAEEIVVCTGLLDKLSFAR